MAAPVVQADYEELEALAGRFDAQASLSNELIQAIRRSADPLVGGGWEGRGIDAFNTEMTGEVYPALVRLHDALVQSSVTTRDIITVLRTAEEDAAAPFESVEGGGIAPGGPGGPGGPGNPGGPGGPGGPGSVGGGGGGGGGGALGDGGGITDFPTVGEGLLGIFELLAPHIESLGEIPGPVGVVLGTILDAWGNPDGDWIQSIASAAIENIGGYGIGAVYPPVAIALAISDVTQLANDITAPIESAFIDLIAANPQIEAGLQSLASDFHDNVELLNLSNITGPLADAVYNVQLAPIVEAASDFWEDPSLSNFADLQLNLATQVAGPPIGFFTNPQHAMNALGDLGDAGIGLADFAVGLTNLQSSQFTRPLAYGAALSVHVTDALPLPGGIQGAVEDSAGFVIDTLDRLPSLPSLSDIL